MSAHLPVLLVVVPLLTAVLAPLLALAWERLARLAALGALGATFLIAVAALWRVLSRGRWHYALGGWAPPWGIEYVIDPLAGGMATLIAAMALLVAVYAGPPLRAWPARRAALFHSLFLLLTAGLLGMVVTGDVFNLYVFLEISSLAAYALLACGGLRATVATFRYLLVGTTAATFYLLGIGYLYALTGTLNMADLAARLPAVASSGVFLVAVCFLAVGLAIKMALFPLHGWLPDAYTYAPPVVIGFIAAVMAKVSAYALLRLFYFVLPLPGAAAHVLAFLGGAAALAVVAGSLLALAQRDVRRMLAYSSVGQMGYIVLGLSLGNAAALTGALLHVFAHAVMKGCLFLVAGGVQWRSGDCRLEAFLGLSRRLPLSTAAFVVAALSMVGLPPTAGFFSKWYLLLGAVQARAWPAVGALVLSSLLGAVYFFRLVEYAYLRPAPETLQRRELPVPMLAPIAVLAASLLLLGLLHQSALVPLIQRALPEVL